MERNANSGIHAIEDRIHKWIPEVSIWRQRPSGGLVEDRRPLNVFTETGGRDIITNIAHNPNDPAAYPFIFIEEQPAMVDPTHRYGRETVTTEHVPYFMRYIIDQNPNDPVRVPQLKAELRKMRLTLRRVLEEIPLFDAVYIPEFSPPATIQDGILHMFITLTMRERTISEPADVVETLEQNIILDGDINGA